MNLDITPKKILFGEEANSALLKGVSQLADAVRVTMGPGGLNVVIESSGRVPILTKDGVTVAKAVNLSNKMENLGVSLVKEAAARTAETAGDGTTTATVLAHSLFSGGLKAISAGCNPVKLRKGIRTAADKIIMSLESQATPISSDEEIIQIGTISSNGEKVIGELLNQAMRQVGRSGTITVEEAKGFNTSLEKVEGIRLDRGFISPYFVNDTNRNLCVFENPCILLANKKISSLHEIMPLLESAHQSSRSLIIIADEIDGEALKGLVLNSAKGILKVAAIKAPEFGSSRLAAMADLGVLLNTKVSSVANENELAKMKLSDLGTCQKIIVSKTETVIVKPSGESDKINSVIKDLESMLLMPGLEQNEKSLLKRRLARLSNGIAILRIGGSTEAELRERKDRVEDALHATRAAVATGILPGGGIALLKAASQITLDGNEDFIAGVNLLKKCCRIPISQIIQNAGHVPEIIIEKILSNEDEQWGWDARSETYGNLINLGIIDPALVVISALEHAVSASDNLLSIACAMHAEES